MENYQELLETEQKSKIDIIKLKEKIDGLGWSIKVLYNDSLVLLNDSGYGENVGNFDLYIHAVKWLTMNINRGAYTLDEKEIIKRIIYHYLKLEVLYKKNESSQIIDSIRLDNELLEYTENNIKKEIRDIVSSSFGNPTLITHLERVLKVQNALLDEEVIRSIVRCNNPSLVRNINKELITSSKERIKSELSKLKEKFSKLADYYVNFKSGVWNLRFKKGSLIFSTVWLLLITEVFITAGVKIPSILKNGGARDYKATIESVSSLGEKENTNEYLASDTPSRILEVYSETYESDGLYYKDIDTYDFSGFETTSDLEKYFSVDLEFLGLEPISTDTVQVEKDFSIDEYKVIKNITLDFNDKRMANKTFDKVMRVALGTFGYVLLIGIAGGIPGMPLQQLVNVLKKSDELKSEKSNFEEQKAIYLEVIKEIEQCLKSNNIELGDIHTLYEEIQTMAMIDGLTPEEINLIKEYEELKGETEIISSSSSYKKLKKLLGKNL